MCIPQIKPVVNEEGLNEIFMLGPAKTIGKAIFRDISELPPAHYLSYKDGRIVIKPYWKLTAVENTETELQAVEHTYALVKDSIERQLISDVPLTTFLSGGLDSSIISKVASDKYKENGMVLDTYSVDYTDNDKYFKKSLFQPNKDSDFIGMMSDAIGSHHHNVVLDNAAVADALAPAAIARCVPGFADVDSSLLLFAVRLKRTLRSVFPENVLTKFSAVIHGITERRYFVKSVSDGQGPPPQEEISSEKASLKMARIIFRTLMRALLLMCPA